MNTEEGLKREIGLWGLTSNIINVTIGSGIFVLPAIVAEGLGSAGILAYLFCGFLITLIMLCFAEVGSKVHITGGAYAYIEVAFGKYFGFLSANLLIFGACLMATAAVANALVDTLSYLLPIFGNRLFRIGFFLTIFSGLAISHVSGVKQGTSLVKVMTIAKLAPLLLLILWGSTKLVVENFLWQKVPAMDDIGKVSLILFFAFQGAESSVSVSGEIKNPRKNVPKGIFLSYAIVLFFYLTIQLVSQGILGDSFASYKDAPLAEVARRVMGPFGTTLMIVGASISMLGYMSGDTMNLPRVLFRSAKDRVIPIKPLSLVHRKFATPYIAVIVYIGLSCLFAITGEFKELAILSSASVLLVYLGVALAVIKLRKTMVPDKYAFRIPGGYIVPILSAVTIFWFLSHLTSHELIGMVITLVVLSAIYSVIKLVEKRKHQESNQ
jgi:basic amino acid/polyamine antiporter, APA family